MADIFINLKRFDIPRRMGGICPKDSPGEWIEWVVGESVERGLGKLAGFNIVYLLPEALILDAFRALNRCPAADREGIRIGSQGVFREDVKTGGNFGAFTT
ncbi:MAG TPA: triosephosphate isomerase, partial [Spirochaetia bacterium]|nr:triosephosphate isomerase [Spirochaetia bacterium]